MDRDDYQSMPIGSLVRIRVHGAKPYLGIVLERIYHNNGKMGYTVYLMELETKILMFEHELEVLSESKNK